MRRTHRFHLDRADHSITVNVRSGRTAEAELLVDGKEVDRRRLHHRGTSTLRAELPEEPAVPIEILVRRPRAGSHQVSCVLVFEGTAEALPERREL